MSTHHTILKANGKPTFVVLPYLEYLELTKAKAGHAAVNPRIPEDGSTPHEVVELMVRNDWSIIRAWREYLGVTQTEMADRLEIRQPSYAKMEATDARPKKATRLRIAQALGLQLEHIS